MSYKGSRHQRREYAVAAPHLLVHDKKDTVGVVVVEGLTAGTDMLGVVTHDDSDFRLIAKNGDTIWKYGQDIGRAVADIGKGEHVHVHNVKTKRW
jgi:(2R)-sulfolactate sulfo-lyase subunit alpha